MKIGTIDPLCNYHVAHNFKLLKQELDYAAVKLLLDTGFDIKNGLERGATLWRTKCFGQCSTFAGSLPLSGSHLACCLCY